MNMLALIKNISRDERASKIKKVHQNDHLNQGSHVDSFEATTAPQLFDVVLTIIGTLSADSCMLDILSLGFSVVGGWTR